MAIHRIELNQAGDKFRIYMKRTVRDINGVDVEIPDGAIEHSIAELDEQIVYWNGQKVNCDNQIAKLENIKTEIANL